MKFCKFDNALQSSKAIRLEKNCRRVVDKMKAKNFYENKFYCFVGSKEVKLESIYRSFLLLQIA